MGEFKEYLKEKEILSEITLKNQWTSEQIKDLEKHGFMIDNNGHRANRGEVLVLPIEGGKFKPFISRSNGASIDGHIKGAESGFEDINELKHFLIKKRLLKKIG